MASDFHKILICHVCSVSLKSKIFSVQPNFLIVYYLNNSAQSVQRLRDYKLQVDRQTVGQSDGQKDGRTDGHSS